MRTIRSAVSLNSLASTFIGLTTCLHLLFFACPGECLYFSQTEWRVTVPANFPVGSPLARIVVVRGALETENSTWHFEIESATPSNPGFEISNTSTSGVVYLSAPLTNASGLSVTLTVAALSTLSHPVKIVVHVEVVNLQSSLTTWCASRAAKEACLLPSGAKFRLTENDPPQLIGSLSFLGYRPLCPNNAVRYWIQADDNALMMDAETGDVWTQRAFDRENISTLPFTYGCNVTIAGEVHTVSRNGAITIEDVNDNGPELKNGHDLELTLDHDHQNVQVGKPLQLNKQLLLKDNDSTRSDYSIEIIGDTSNFFNVVMSEIKFSGPAKHIYRKVELFVKRALLFPGDSYRISLIFKDVTLLPRYGNNQAVVNVIIYNKTTASNVSQQYDVTVCSNASKYSQVLGPIHKHLGKATEIKFSLEADSPEAKGVFNVTPNQGIVYVLDPPRLQALSLGSVGLRLSWSFPATPALNNATWINVTIVAEPNTAFDNTTSSCDQVASCAVSRESESCYRSCGPGSPRGSCQWLPVAKHSTCVSNLVTCPDKQCDELESLDWNLCPQDCADNVIPQSSKGESGRGINIDKGLGSCWCDPSVRKCQCFSGSMGSDTDQEPPGPADQPVVQQPRRPGQGANDDQTGKPLYTPGSKIAGQINDSTTMPHVTESMPESECGTVCIIVASCLVFSTLLGLVTFVTYRLRWCIFRRKGRGRPKYLGSGTSLSAVPSDYVDERSASVVSQNIVLPGESHVSAPIKLHMPADAKWEFPRSQLIIEQTLGEGEFGKVMRAKAFGINGTQGFSTVAVKMLKSNGTNTELKDLMSEYNLLKEVNHPNVIKLFGACTTKSGPLYIIVEYAEHGSLRSYLRKSRQLEFDTYSSEDSGVGSIFFDSHGAAGGNGSYHVTSNDLLSFMWQISKGMTYLSEMKLVHRDLATRNLLVAAGKVIKISDFGLSRDVYEGDTYFKTSKGRVPVKWLAIESLVNHVYTSKSDVWSFGVVMWEIVMLGASPYPGVPPERLFYLLRTGYRMEKPTNCSDHLYRIIRSCWKENPHERPSFKELTLKFDNMLQENVEYLDLSSNIVHNMTYFESQSIRAEEEFSDIHYGSFNFLSKEDDEEYLTRQGAAEQTENMRLLAAAGQSEVPLSPLGGMKEAVV